MKNTGVYSMNLSLILSELNVDFQNVQLWKSSSQKRSAGANQIRLMPKILSYMLLEILIKSNSQKFLKLIFSA
jgi:hypothetical protein